MTVVVDADTFAELSRRYRRELQLHCYRMLGSAELAEEHVQEVFLRAWRGRDGFEERASARTWLYRIATNACLDTLRRAEPSLQPYPDQLLDDAPGPDAVAVGRETVSLAFMAAIRLLPPRQRAVFVLRDVLAFSAAEAAGLLGIGVTAANSALQRARETLRGRWPGGRLQWPARGGDAAEREIVRRYIEAHESADPEKLIALLSRDVRLSIEPGAGVWDGRDPVAAGLREGMNTPGAWRMVPTAANRQPAVAAYVRAAGAGTYRAFAIIVLRVEDGRLAGIDAWEEPALFTRFGLPDSSQP
ncbi:sigma-70 family RNA polymerase sigma factor [Dactylosporangium sp. CA-139066]|uniref:sigma-70 family RNA polymerase sigma factor n=1 Tax=Dactylosporangium sp. CA-139066 TaxID=3239930 RepID=UPI003D8EE45D